MFEANPKDKCVLAAGVDDYIFAQVEKEKRPADATGENLPAGPGSA